MKKAAIVFLSMTAAFVLLIVGVFIGRNTSSQQMFVHTEETEVAIDSDSTKWDLNTLTMDQLMDLPGIGETLAQRILDYKEENGPFTSVDELINVDGIGQARIEQLREYLIVGGTE